MAADRTEVYLACQYCKNQTLQLRLHVFNAHEWLLCEDCERKIDMLLEGDIL